MNLPLNVALPVELGTLVSEKGILITGELAAIASELPCLHRQSDSLGLVDGLAVGVCDVQVIDTTYSYHGVRMSETGEKGCLALT